MHRRHQQLPSVQDLLREEVMPLYVCACACEEHSFQKNGTFFSKDSSLTKGVDFAYGHKALSHFWRGLQEGLDFMFAGTVIDMNVVLYHRFYLGFVFFLLCGFLAKSDGSCAWYQNSVYFLEVKGVFHL